MECISAILEDRCLTARIIAHRNFFANGGAITGNTGRDRLFKTEFLIQNNYFNYDIDGKPLQWTIQNASNISFIYFDLTRFIYYYENVTYPYSFTILNNLMLFPTSSVIRGVSGEIIYQGNKTLNEPSVNPPTYSSGIRLYSTDKIIVGGENPGEANVIYGSELVLTSPKSALIQRNSVYCVYGSAWYQGVPYSHQNQPAPFPTVSIDKITANVITGSATPLSKVELFWDDDCSRCQPLTYITTVNADGNGKWTYTGSIQKGVIASATLNGYTSTPTETAIVTNEYARPITTIHYSCQTDGSISGITTNNAGGYKWTDQNGNVISNEADAKSLKPGVYQLSFLNGTCTTTRDFKIYDATPNLIDTYKQINHPSCSSKGSISGLTLHNDNNQAATDAGYAGINNIYTYKWIDASGNVNGTSLYLSDADAGSYILQITYNNNCTRNFGPYVLSNTTGPNINQSAAITSPTNCGQNLGSITGIQVTGGTGTLKYSWKNAAGTQVATTKDLTNQPGGIYTLSVTDDTSCGSVSTSPIIIPETNGITLNDDGVVTQPDCNGTTGSIKGITVTGATLYQWTRSGMSSSITTPTPELLNAQPGSYRLLASNGSGCSKSSQEYVVRPAANNETYGGITKTIVDATCGLNNGIITATFQDATTIKPKSVRWVQQSTGQTVSNSLTLAGLDAGNYDLYATAQNGCERFLITYTVARMSMFQVSTANATVKDEECGQANGSITGISISQGNTPVYTWTNAAGQVVGSTINLTNKPAGLYTLKIQDGSCQQTLPSFSIGTGNAVIPQPQVKDMQLCSGGDALVSVANPTATFGYKLYDDLLSPTPILTQTSGKFNVKIASARSYYISQYIGTCESSRAEIKISVGIANVNIANTFTPNSDGINDTWKINSIENHPNALVQVFNRHGDKIFESRGYSKQFDGTYQGQVLPIGTYYYIINLNTGCNLLTGSLTLVR